MRRRVVFALILSGFCTAASVLARYMPFDLDATVRFADGAQSEAISVRSNQFLFGFGVSVRF